MSVFGFVFHANDQSCANNDTTTCNDQGCSKSSPTGQFKCFSSFHHDYVEFYRGKTFTFYNNNPKKGWMIEIDLLQWLGEDQKITLACTFYWFSTSYLWGHRCWRGHRGTRVVFQPFPVMITMSFINTCARIECHIKAIVVSIAPSNHTKLPVIHAPKKPIVLSANFVKIGCFAII